MCVCMCVCVYVYVCMCMCVLYGNISSKYVCKLIFMKASVYIRKYVYKYIYVCVYVCVSVCVCTYIRMYFVVCINFTNLDRTITNLA